jgi:DNA-binding beta-propeller fold protein YncE
VVLDRRTRTLYIAGDDQEGSDDQGRLFVVDARRCSARSPHCANPLASVPLGRGPAGVAVDSSTGTVFVANVDDGTVSVIDARHCHARNVSGCRAAPALVTVGGHPLGLQLDRRTHTLYVGNEDPAIAVVDTSRCNARRPAGCAAAPIRLAAGDAPVFPFLDRASHTLYVPHNTFNPAGDTVSVIDAASCNATTTTGCTRTAPTFPVGVGAIFATVDHRTGTLYVSNQGVGAPGDGSASVVDATRCNARTTAGCPTSTPPSTLIGPGAFNVEVSPRTHTLYGLASESDIVAAVDTRHCRAHDTAGCARKPRTLQTGGDPFWMSFDRRTSSLYVVNHADSTLQVLDAHRCSAVRTAGCRREAPAVPATDAARLDSPLHTLYQAFPDQTLGFVDTNTCNVARRARCAPVARVPLGFRAGSIQNDPSTHTLYLVDFDAQAVKLVDAATCNVTRHTNCRPFATIHVPSVGGAYVDPVSHTLYAPQGGLGTIAVLPGSHCNAVDRSRCNQPPHEARAGTNAFVVSFDHATGTVYVSDPGSSSVVLLPKAACDAGTAACRSVAQTTVGAVPIGLASVPGVHTLYVASIGTGTVTLVDTRACNAGHTTGCGTRWRSTATPRLPFGVDVAGRRIVVSNWDANVDVIDSRQCSVVSTGGCDRSWPRIPVGYRPVFFQADPRHHTLYTFNFYDQSMSLLNLRLPS